MTSSIAFDWFRQVLRAAGLAGSCVVAHSGAAFAQSNLEAWHEHGQTWLRWSDDQTFSGAESWSIYRSSGPITDLAGAELIGRLYPQDAHAQFLKSSDPNADWVVPDPQGAGALELDPTEALFVYTPHAAVEEYFAVVKTGDTALSTENTAGPIVQTLDPVVPHVQRTGIDDGHPYTIYALWIDGATDEDSGRSDFPVMGNASFNGTAKIFCVFEPTTGLPAPPMPAVAFLHGGGGNHWNFRPSKSVEHGFSAHVEDGLYVTFDDRNWIRPGAPDPDVPTIRESRWFGFARNYDRFEPADSVAPPDDEVVVDSTCRFLDWTLDWLIATQSVDPERFSMAGFSMGGRGASLFVRRRPDRFSGATLFSTASVEDVPLPWYAMWGSAAQDLPTPLGVGFYTALDPALRLSTLDLPFLRMVSGTADVSHWSPVPPTYTQIDADRWGAALYWDERDHAAGNGGWTGAHFVGSSRFNLQALTRLRRDAPFPAIHAVDHLVGVAGVQPDPGDGVVPANGDSWGTWGGWFDHDPRSIVDTTDRWSVTLGLVQASSFANDLPPTSTATASVTIRRAQAFLPSPGEQLAWRLRPAAGGVTIASGLLLLGADGVVTVGPLPFGTQPLRLDFARAMQTRGWLPIH